MAATDLETGVKIVNAPAAFKSEVWKKFGFVQGSDRKQVACRLCFAVLAYSGNTTNMSTHLRRHHGIMQTGNVTITTIDPTPSWCSETLAVKSVKSLSETHTSDKAQSTLFRFKSSTSTQKLTVPEKQRITSALTEFIVDDLRPFKLVESAKFKKLISILEPGYVVPGRHHLSEVELPNLYEDVKVKVLNSLREATTVALTTDGWTSRVTESYVTVTVQFIDKNWEMKSYVLQTRRMDEKHTGVNIAGVISAAVVEWGLMDKHPALVSDNAANMVVAARECGLTPFVRCFAHTLNLVVFFHKSTVANTILKQKQKLLGLSEHKLKIDVSTRWNSAYDMLERYLEQQAAVYAALLETKDLRKRESDLSTLNDGDISNAEEVVKTMAQLKKATVALCTEKGPTLSLICPLLHKLSTSLVAAAGDTTLVKNLKKAMHDNLETRYEDDRLFLQTATFLDPRFKQVPFLNEEEKDRTVKSVQGMALSTVQQVPAVRIKQEPPDAVPRPQMPTLPALPTLPQLDQLPALPTLPQLDQDEHVSGPALPLSSLIFVSRRSESPPPRKVAALDDLLGDVFVEKVEEAKPLTPQEIIEKEISIYANEQPIKLTDNPLVWWREHSIYCPHLAKVAKHLLGVPATSVPSERVFSTTGDILSAQRSGLKAKYVDVMIFLKKNM
ncbi:E3 SUMO-protein ligase ZBED1-like [Ylistrum balloti]|uniref:E3 SUMO-protein ligase ZBED1-like n=1 Tax=Ylistrum balloti TaxID=509963 RepID=UPI0029057F49|nr:E3 SUMO-protein ligase ZBED1-like [Ylistrum balloti]